jgi:hypothetical protein
MTSCLLLTFYNFIISTNSSFKIYTRLIYIKEQIYNILANIQRHTHCPAYGFTHTHTFITQVSVRAIHIVRLSAQNDP